MDAWHTYVCMYVCMYVWLDVCIHMYIYIYMYAHGPARYGSRQRLPFEEPELPDWKEPVDRFARAPRALLLIATN